VRRETWDPGGTKKGAAAPDTRWSRSKHQISCDYTSGDEGWVRTRRRGDQELLLHQEKEEMRVRVWGSPDVGRVPGCVRTQGMLPGSVWKRGKWRGVATQVMTHRTHGTHEMRRLRQDATPTGQTQGPFLLMDISCEIHHVPWDPVHFPVAPKLVHDISATLLRGCLAGHCLNNCWFQNRFCKHVYKQPRKIIWTHECAKHNHRF